MNDLGSDQRNEPSSYSALMQKMYSLFPLSPVTLWLVALPLYTSFTTPVGVASLSLYPEILSAFFDGARQWSSTASTRRAGLEVAVAW